VRRTIATVGLLVLISGVARAQERLPEDKARKSAEVLAEKAKALEDLPIKTDVDVTKPFGIHSGEYGAMVVPDKTLAEETIEGAGDRVKPVGQLWMHLVAPAVDGAVTPSDRLRFVTFTVEDRDYDVALFLLGVKGGSDGSPVLVIYAGEKEPLLSLPLTKTDSTQELPIELDGKKVDDDSGDLTIRVLGKYRATMRVKAQEP